MKKKKHYKPRGINVTASPKVYDLIVKEANKTRPRKTLRKVLNIKYNVPENE